MIGFEFVTTDINGFHRYKVSRPFGSQTVIYFMAPTNGQYDPRYPREFANEVIDSWTSDLETTLHRFHTVATAKNLTEFKVFKVTIEEITVTKLTQKSTVKALKEDYGQEV